LKWRIKKVDRGWVIQYKRLFFWETVIRDKGFSWEPDEPYICKTAEEATVALGRMMREHGGTW